MRRVGFLLLVSTALLLQACAGTARTRNPYDRSCGCWKGAGSATTKSVKSPPAEPVASGTRETGLASFYASDLDGKPTASGEAFSSADHTCAHRAWPFGTRVKVTSVKSGKSTEVRVNDRGPHVSGRILDLSRAAADDIGLNVEGVGEVEAEVVQ